MGALFLTGWANGIMINQIKKETIHMDFVYQKQAEKGKQCQDCQSFSPKPDNAAEGTCFGKDVVAEGGCMFFKKKEV